MKNSENKKNDVKINENLDDFYIERKPKSKAIAGLLGIFLGIFGVHNFYLGYTTKGITQFLISILSCLTLSPISIIWGIVEGILILSGNIDKDAEDLPLE